jgi:hypothetical protein
VQAFLKREAPAAEAAQIGRRTWMKTQRANPVRIGIFVIGGLVILAAAVVILGSGRLFQRTHALVSYFDGSVNGLRAGASVKFKGVEVGTVDRIRIPGASCRPTGRSRCSSRSTATSSRP